MRPLTGIVIEATNTSLKVKLETGTTKTINLPYYIDVQIGQALIVGYNFLTNEIKIIDKEKT